MQATSSAAIIVSVSDRNRIRPLKKSADFQNVPRPVAVMAQELPRGHVDAQHSHPRAQLLYACAGVMSVMTDEASFMVPPQRAVWLPSGTEHEVHYRAPVSLRTLYIDPAASSSLPAKCRVIEVSELLRALILRAAILPVNYDLDGPDGRVMTMILDEIAAMPTIPLHAPIPNDERLARVCRAMLKDPVRKGSLEDWARVAGMSRRNLTRVFRRETGMSFLAWRQHVQLLEALSRLAIGHPVTTVALDVGYRNPSSFSAMFRRTFGVTPSHYFSGATDSRPASNSKPAEERAASPSTMARMR